MSSRGAATIPRLPSRVPLDGVAVSAGPHDLERLAEKRVLFGGAGGDANRRRRAEAVQRPDDHSLLEQALEERAAVRTEIDVKEVRHSRPDGCLLYTSDAADEEDSVDRGG